MPGMAQAQELIEKPLSSEELAERYRALCDDPCFTNVPGKIELDVWGRVLMTPPSAYHGRIQGRLSQKLVALGGTTFVEAPIVTPAGLFLADVAWASAAFLSAHRSEISLTRAPEICIEVVSPSNSVKELEEKKSAYLAAGAEEVWIVYPKSKRCELYGSQGRKPESAYRIEFSGVFD